MNNMDLKGIPWVGNMCQKIESFCVEVDETVYQDTAKYVEEHMRSVGETFKKLYTDVMQDLLPSSSSSTPHVAQVKDTAGETFTESVNTNESEKMVQSCINNSVNDSSYSSVEEEKVSETVKVEVCFNTTEETEQMVKSCSDDALEVTSRRISGYFDGNYISNSGKIVENEADNCADFVTEQIELGQSCVLAEKSEDPLSLRLPVHQCKHKSYKKKIRNVFGIRRIWPKRKETEEQHGVWYREDSQGVYNAHSSDSLDDSDWELI